jgi:hypothetical protein
MTADARLFTRLRANFGISPAEKQMTFAAQEFAIWRVNANRWRKHWRGREEAARLA